MQIMLNDLVRLKNLTSDQFNERFKIRGLDAGKITREQYEEFFGLWYCLNVNFTTPEEYFEKEVRGTYIPNLNGDPIKIIL